MTFLVSSAPLLSGKFAVRAHSGLGILPANIPTDGDYPNPLLNDELIAGHEYAVFVDTPPTNGSVTVYPDGSYLYQAASDETDTFTLRVYDDGRDAGTQTQTITTGTFGATAGGGTLTGTSTITPGSATADGVATGAGLTSASVLATGATIGASDAAVGGATLTGTSSVDAGGAGGESVAPGATLIGDSTLMPGMATSSSDITLTSADLAAIDALVVARASDIAAAVLAAAAATPIKAITQDNVLEASVTEAQALRIMLAALSGRVTKSGTNIKFKSVDTLTDRIDGTVDAEGNRTAVTLNGVA